MNYYGCTFILYELSTPFLNIHWFFDKLNMTGSKAQLYNGLTLLFTFFSCRLVWGTIQSGFVYRDMWRAVFSAPSAEAIANSEVMGFASGEPIPVWLAVIYTASNLTLNSLNWHWFFKMIAAVKKRFEPVKEEAAEKVEVDGAADGVAASAKTTGAEKPIAGLRMRRSTIEEMIVPDSEELREGTIQ